MSFTKSFGVASGSAVIYEVVYATSQWANTQPAVTTMISNGEMVELGTGVALAALAWYGIKKGSSTIAALSLPASAFLIVDAIANIIKKNLGSTLPAQFGSVARVRPVRQVSPSPALTPGFGTPLLTSSN